MLNETVDLLEECDDSSHRRRDIKNDLTGETNDRFSRIDIESRKYFPIAFCILISSYWIAYVYYFTDEFPVQDMNPFY
jgi:hypothetical protein